MSRAALHNSFIKNSGNLHKNLKILFSAKDYNCFSVEKPKRDEVSSNAKSRKYDSTKAKRDRDRS